MNPPGEDPTALILVDVTTEEDRANGQQKFLLRPAGPLQSGPGYTITGPAPGGAPN